RRPHSGRRDCAMPELSQPGGWLPLVFMGLMGLSMLIYVVLDGYDLGVGILRTAFPVAHGVILGALYLPVALMLGGLILRGVAFDFRVKAHAAHKAGWNFAFFAGSLLAAVAQGVMLGRYITGFAPGVLPWLFALFVGASLAAGYVLLGAGWLLMKTEGELQQRAARWGRASLGLTAAGVLAISLATPWVSPRIFEKWFSFPNLILLAPVPVMTAVLFTV